MCTEQAAGVNDFFRAYGRLFNFQYQSYLISYCVYTAATIDVRLVRHDDKTLAEMAAGRLAVTLRMLETEVKQTPGIKRSIEIIRSQIGEPRPSNAQSSAQRSSRLPDASSAHRAKQTSMPLETMMDSLQQPAPPPSTVHETSLYGSERVVAESPPLPLSEGLRNVLDPNLPLEPGWLDWNMDDLGGGFVPDMAYWSFFDQHV